MKLQSDRTLYSVVVDLMSGETVNGDMRWAPLTADVSAKIGPNSSVRLDVRVPTASWLTSLGCAPGRLAVRFGRGWYPTRPPPNQNDFLRPGQRRAEASRVHPDRCQIPRRPPSAAGVPECAPPNLGSRVSRNAGFREPAGDGSRVQLSDLDRSVRVDGPSGVVGHFPHVVIRIGKRPCRSSPGGLSRRPHDGPPGSFGIRQNNLHFLWRADVVGEFDSGSTVTTESSPKTEHHPACLEEAHFIVGLLSAGSTQRLIETTSSGQVGHAEGHQTDALFHMTSMTCDMSPNERPRTAVLPMMRAWPNAGWV